MLLVPPVLFRIRKSALVQVNVLFSRYVLFVSKDTVRVVTKRCASMVDVKQYKPAQDTLQQRSQRQ